MSMYISLAHVDMHHFSTCGWTQSSRPESIPAPVTLSPDLPRSPHLTQLNSIEIPDGRLLECAA